MCCNGLMTLYGPKRNGKIILEINEGKDGNKLELETAEMEKDLGIMNTTDGRCLVKFEAAVKKSKLVKN